MCGPRLLLLLLAVVFLLLCGLGFRVYGLWFLVFGLWCMVYGLGFAVRVEDLEMRFYGFGLSDGVLGFRV